MASGSARHLLLTSQSTVMPELLNHTNRRVLVIDDNESIHEDFRTILCANSTSGASLEAAEADLFGESDSEPNIPSFEIDSAYQGEQGLALIHRSLKQKRPYA